MSHSDMFIMKTFTFLFISFVLSVTAVAASFGEVVEVKKSIPLSNEEEPFKDFYIKLNSASGLKKNLVVKVLRKVEVKDTSSKVVGDFKTVVGQLKLIQIDAKVAVAREYKLTSRAEEPVLEQVGIMIGDEVDLAESFVDNSKPKTQRNPADVSGDKAVILAVPSTESVENSSSPGTDSAPIKIKSDSLSRDI